MQLLKTVGLWDRVSDIFVNISLAIRSCIVQILVCLTVLKRSECYSFEGTLLSELYMYYISSFWYLVLFSFNQGLKCCALCKRVSKILQKVRNMSACAKIHNCNQHQRRTHTYRLYGQYSLS